MHLNVRVLLITRFRCLSMKVAASNRDALSIVHVAWLSDAMKRLKQTDFQAVWWTWTCRMRRVWKPSTVFQLIEATTRERVVPRMESKPREARTIMLLPTCLPQNHS
jgi:hypothetical protein